MEKITLEKFYKPTFKQIEISKLLEGVELVIYHSMWFEYRVNNMRKGKLIFHETYAKEYDGDKNYTALEMSKFPLRNYYYISKQDFEKITEYITANKIRATMFSGEENWDRYRI